MSRLGSHLGRGVGVAGVVSVVLLVGDAIGRGAEHLRRGQVHKPGVESSDDLVI